MAQLCSHYSTCNNVIWTIVQLTLKAWASPLFTFSKIFSQSHEFIGFLARIRTNCRYRFQNWNVINPLAVDIFLWNLEYSYILGIEYWQKQKNAIFGILGTFWPFILIWITPISILLYFHDFMIFSQNKREINEIWQKKTFYVIIRLKMSA